MDTVFPPAKPGDICILLVPAEEDKPALRQRQVELHDLFGGQIVEDIHITCQKFCVTDGRPLKPVLRRLSRCITGIQPFLIYAGSYIHFYSDFWKFSVLRWRVLEDKDWCFFQGQVEETLDKVSCPPHYRHGKPATCTAVNLDREINLEMVPREIFPFPLFRARKVLFSRIKSQYEFEILETVILEGL